MRGSSEAPAMLLDPTTLPKTVDDVDALDELL
jgi:hypothetical protein